MFRAIGPHEIPDVWEFTEPGLQKIIERCKATWTIRDIRRHLRSGRATLFVRDEGFVVLERCTESISQEPYLNVWLMWFQNGAAAKLKDDLVAWLDAVRDQQRCEWWEFGSPREEWAAAMDSVCERFTTVWRRKR